MSILPVDGVPENYRVVETPAPLVDVPSHAEAVAPPVPTAEQVQAIDGAFIRQHQEQQTIASVLGLRLSLLLLHDLAMDAAPAGGDEEDERKKPVSADDPSDEA